MITYHEIVSDTYHDSVQLMRIASDVTDDAAVRDAQAVMGTPANQETLLDAGRLTEAELADVGPDDLILVAAADEEAAAKAAVTDMATKLTEHSDSAASEDNETLRPRSVRRATADSANPQVAMISVPGEYAAREAWKALDEGLDVCIFSDNVSIEHERKLKQAAHERDQLLMGPDCGTAIVDGVPFGFANAVADGSIGIAAASGTGLQAVSSRVSRRGGGISHAIGTGGRDLSAEVAGLTTRMAITALDEDPATSVIVVLSKPPSEPALQALQAPLSACSTPVLAHFQGENADYDGMQTTHTLADTADSALELAGYEPSSPEQLLDGEAFEAALDEAAADSEWIRGLFTGGTLCTEAALRVADTVSSVHSNVGVGTCITDSVSPSGHALVDLGADTLTEGRPHPMIDPTLRNEYLETALHDDTVGLVLLDLVLGYGAHDDPAGEVANVLEDHETDTVVLASVCGTDDDPQNRGAQIATLEEAGVFVVESNAAAADRAAQAAKRFSTRRLEEGSL